MTIKKTKDTSLEVNLTDKLVNTILEKQERLKTIDTQIESLIQERKEQRFTLKESVSDLYQFKKYLDEKQQAYIDGLNLESLLIHKKGKGTGNALCTIALDVLIKHGKAMTNENLHHAYIDTVPSGIDAQNYTAFNISIRPLINSGKIIRKFIEKGNSKTAIMSINEN